MNKLPNHTALKEWASVIDALGPRRSDRADPQRRPGRPALRRRGGSLLSLSRRTTTKTTAAGLQPGHVPITHWAEVVRTWQVRDIETLYRLEPLVAMDRATLDTRYQFRPDQAINVIAVRAWRLAKPVECDDDGGVRRLPELGQRRRRDRRRRLRSRAERGGAAGEDREPSTRFSPSPSDVELIVVIAMLAIGGIVALAVGDIAFAAAQREAGSSSATRATPPGPQSHRRVAAVQPAHRRRHAARTGA